MANEIEAAGMAIPPPLAYAGPLGIGLLLNRFFPQRFLPRSITRALGRTLIGLSLLLGASSAIVMRRARTPLSPAEPSTSIVDGGPFAYSRNPIYVSFMLLYAGVAVLANALWAILLLPISIFLVRKQVIEREEPYLERTFGETYLRYKDRVGRWI